MIGRLDAASSSYAQSVRDALIAELGDDVVAIYLYGSALTDEFVPGRSDLDVVTVIRTWLPVSAARAAIERLRDLPRPTSLKGLDIWLVPLVVARSPRPAPGYQARMLTSVGAIHHDCGRQGDPRLAMLLAICRDHGAALVGPPPEQLIPHVPRAATIGGMLVDLESRAPAHYLVLNACRDLHFLTEGRLCSKLDGAAWARARVNDPELVDQAVYEHVHGDGPPIDRARVDAFVAPVAARLRAALPPGVEPVSDTWRRSPPPLPDAPAVTCVMPTYNRRPFVERSIRLFLAQDYPNCELVIVDDGEDGVADLVPPGAPIRHLHLPARATIGHKRNLAAEATGGDVIVQWDDDDWYGPARLRRQLAPLVAGRADLTAIRMSWLMDVDDRRFYRFDGEPVAGAASLAAGTLAMTADLWRRCGRYPDASKREDVTMLLRAFDLGGRVEGVANDGVYVYVRHGGNSWRFDRTPDEQPGWAAVERPDFLPVDELDGYVVAAAVVDGVGAHSQVGVQQNRPSSA
jgi:hypothetical protein